MTTVSSQAQQGCRRAETTPVDEFAEAEREYTSQGQGGALNGQSQSYAKPQESAEAQQLPAIDLKPLIQAAKYRLLPESCDHRIYLPSGRHMDDWNTGVSGMTQLYTWAKKGGRVNSEANPYRAEHIMDREKTDMEYTAEYMHMTGAYDEIVAALAAGVRSPEELAKWRQRRDGRR